MKIIIYITVLFIFCFSSCNENQFNIELDDKETILLDTDYNIWLNKEYSYLSWEPKQEDFDVLRDVINGAIDNNKFDFIKKPIKNNLTRYYRQYIPYINKQNERVIKINALCEILEIPPSSSENKNEFTKMDWKNQYIEVDDGGSCYWQMDVNISTRKIN